jgi:Bacterial transcriptional activator domain
MESPAPHTRSTAHTGGHTRAHQSSRSRAARPSVTRRRRTDRRPRAHRSLPASRHNNVGETRPSTVGTQRSQLWTGDAPRSPSVDYRSGRHAEALRSYEKFRRILAEELGLDPSPSIRRLQERVLLHDPTPGPEAAAEPTMRPRMRNPYKGLRPFGEGDAADSSTPPSGRCSHAAL